ncbi:Phosphoinositide phospholipase C, Ca2+-dependent [Pustulibacterium marinum]|uniref:Phosphoinositide phospholipase C, Ca2+-dependent n=1 Tax=Pustulibacterium marinum TaxID=1224947 RepID=A0A1I7G1H1_9FLAO|nr:phosphatidylinositol-specific phospholipase C1-like protein [Pustulibacterium marinum]SFU42161.1 Phosphoinositide phospholipase C, Ca2+-dependent [Pustulibacterium marinum]
MKLTKPFIYIGVLLGAALSQSCETTPKKEQEIAANTPKINQVQVIGSHNSYKNAIDAELFAYLAEQDSTGGIYGLQYEHIPLLKQLDMGLRNIELDAYADSLGGKYANPKGMELVPGQPAYDPEGKLAQPGFKMIHVTDIDYRTQYYLLADCLSDLKKWSEAHPDHGTIFVTLEPKDGKANRFGTAPEAFTSTVFDELDKTLLKYLGKEHILTPDDVRGTYATLNEAVRAGQWPTVTAGKGKFLFILDTKGEKEERYAAGHPSLKGRVLFINAEAGTPEAGAMILNNPEDERIPEYVKAGYIIRTRADANTKEARANDYSHFEAAKQSGAQIITTDYYQPSQLFESTYHINFGEGVFSRPNPIIGAE